MTEEVTFADLVSVGMETYEQAYMRSFLPQIVQVGLEEGLSGRQMLAQIRAGGMAIADRTLYTVMSEVNAVESKQGAWLAMDPTAVPQASDFVAWNVQRGEGLMYRFEVLVEDAEGNRSWLPRGVKSMTPVAPGDLMQDLADLFTEPANQEGEEPYEETFLGLRLSGLYQLVPSR